MTDRRWMAQLAALHVAALVAGGCASRGQQDAEFGNAVSLTFIKALPGERENLERFIRENWLVMDSVAVERGLMASYRMVAARETDREYDLIVIVHYPDDRGYAGIAEQFERIRASHAPVLVDGKSFRQLGTIVRSETLYDRTKLPASDGG